MRRGFFVALAVVAAANIGALAGVARNRSGEPDATVLLEERELELLPVERESSAMRLRLRYQNAALSLDPRAAEAEGALAPPFLDEARLRALGFDCSVPAASDRAAAFYETALPRPGFVVFEVGGKEWDARVAAWQRRETQRVEEQIAGGQLTGSAAERARTEIVEAPRRMSRLMPIDAGRDAATLRLAHPDRTRVLILPAVFGLEFRDRQQPGGPALHGRLLEVFPSILAVPPEARAPLETLREPPSRDRPAGPQGRVSGWGLRMLDHNPRYEVHLLVGRALQPWVDSARRLP